MALLMSSASVRAWLGNLVLGSTITLQSASNASPTVIGATAHGLSSGDVVFQFGFTTNTAANGVFWVTVVDANDYKISNSWANYVAGTFVAGNGVTSTGSAQRITVNLTPHDVENMARTLRSMSYHRDTDQTYLKGQPFSGSNPILIGTPTGNSGVNALESTIQTIFGQ